MQQAPINPKKVPGKFTPPTENTDLTADPIDNPPKTNLPPPKAEFIKPVKDTQPINAPSLYLSIMFLLATLLLPVAIPTLFTFQGSSALSAIAQIVLAFATLFFNFQNSHLQAKSFPRLGINPLHIITVIACLALILGAYNLFIWFLSGGA